jgi:Response regulators consisting of a CheY-like receiver domain and a winged-helix DNA-binding domain
MQANILLYGLDDALANELTSALSSLCGDVSREEFSSASLCRSAVAAEDIGLIFCSPQPQLVRDLRTKFGSTPIVVVSRFPEVTDWLDALEAGAADYCAAPFETHQIRWILDSSLRYAQAAA